MSASKKILVTGATGFLGHHAVQSAIERGYEVVALCRNPESSGARRLPESTQRVKGDILDKASVRAAAQGCQLLLHCAGMVSRDPEDSLLLHERNVTGTENVLDAAREAGITRAVHASTSGTIGLSRDAEHIASEDDPPPTDLINQWPYYRTKLYSEQTALERNHAEFAVLVVNPALLLGPGDLQGSSTEDVQRALNERVPVATAGGISFVDARDAADGMLDALEKGRAGERYLLAACNCSIRTFFHRIARIAGTKAPPISMPDNDLLRKTTLWAVERASKWLGQDTQMPDAHTVDMAQHYWYVDASKAEQELGWRPRDPMETLADTIEDLRQRGVVMMSAPR